MVMFIVQIAASIWKLTVFVYLVYMQDLELLKLSTVYAIILLILIPHLFSVIHRLLLGAGC